MFYLPFFLALIAPPLLQSASIDLGQVFQPEEKYFTITATNTRTDPLVLQRLILTCPCFEGDMKEGTLRPGEGVSIE
ncbi:MAG TPA: DUF1573 domain-containing protein, partial [bacterium]|nr:DUF1573 domain-containing protein [bacterium]